MSSKVLKIANGQGFWGDCISAPEKLIKYGKIDYLTLDYLAEVTISIMQRQKNKDPKLGYAVDFLDLVKNNIHLIKENNIKIIANAGGVNPESCRDKILEIAKKENTKINVAIVKGDDIFTDIDQFIKEGVEFNNLYTNESFNNICNDVYSANVYIDSFSIAKALSLGADIVLCGRVSDPGLLVGPCIYEFNWSEKDFNKLASATVAGHILECGAQCTGGNYTDWKNVSDFANIGYPIAEIKESGNFDITKPENSGGLINRYTITEQILYELGDPKQYISPDVCVDFTSIKLREKGKNRVSISDVIGSKPTETFKVSMSYFKGYKSSGQLTVSGPDALDKAKLASEIIWEKLRSLGIKYDENLTEYLGLSSCQETIYKMPDYINEVVLRLGVKSFSYNDVSRFTKELSPLITSGPPGITGFASGRPKIHEIVAYWPTLIDKNKINTVVTI